MIKYNNKTINDWYFDDKNIIKVYKNNAVCYYKIVSDGDTPTPPAPSYDEQYLTIESTSDDNTISFTMGTGMTTAITTAVTSVSVSTDDGVTWTSMENIGANASLSVTLNNGEKALWKGEALGYSITTATTKSTLFSSTGNYKVYGNITSLLYDDDFLNHCNPTLPDFNCFTNLFNGSTGLTDASNLIMHFELPATTSKRQLCYLFKGCTSLVKVPELKNIGFGGSQYTFRNMFDGCTSLTTAPELPATTLANNCYNNMFRGCTRLTTAPELPADILAQGCYSSMFYGCTNLTVTPALPVTTLVESCYFSMFQGCTNLTTAPELPATTLASKCYSNMFNGCTSLTTAPELPATTLADNCYNQMFYGCRNLSYIKCLATNISASNCTKNWVSNVASTGTFVKAASMGSWTTGINGIPSGWTIVNA